MFYRENVDYPELIWEDLAFQVDHRLITKETVDVSEESKRKPELVNGKTASRRVVKKKFTIFSDDNIITDDPDVALELGKPVSLTKAKEAEATRKVHVTHARIVTEFVFEFAKKKSGGRSYRGDEEVTDAAKEDTEKTSEVKDDAKKIELPPTSSNLYVSLGFGDQFLKISFDSSLVSTVKDTTDAEFNSFLDVKIQSKILHIQSLSMLRVPVSVISKPLVLTPVQESPSIATVITLPPPSVYTTPSLRVAKFKKDVSKHKKIDLSTEALVALKTQVPSVVDNYPGSKSKKKKRRRTKESESSKKPSTSKDTPKGKAPSKGFKTGKSVTAKEPVKEPTAEVVMDDVGEDVVYDDDQPQGASEPKLKHDFQQVNKARDSLFRCDPFWGCYTNHQVNVQFLLQLQPKWQRFVTLVKQSQELKTVSHHKLYDILKQHQNEVNEIRAERLAHTTNPLVLVAQQQPVYHPQNHPTHYTQNSSTRSQQAATKNRGKAIVNSPPPIYDQEPTMVTEDDEMSKDKEIDKLMALIYLSFKKIYKPANNNLRTSSNTSRANQDNSLRISRGTRYDNQRIVNVVEAREAVGTPLVQKSGIQCYNCKEHRHVARECQKLKRAKDVAYHKEKILLYAADNSGPIFDTDPLQKLVEIILFIVDSGCSKHITGNLKLLTNFVEKFLGTVKFRNDQIAPILGYGDLVQGTVTIKRVYYVEGLNHNLFFVGQFCDANLEVAFRKSTCYIRDLKGNDLLTGSRGTDLYSITLQDTSSPNLICLMAKATSSQAWASSSFLSELRHHQLAFKE
uniref:Integrase, catalytic region, zinc finger, CCHC-type, peptidase aspartic, catalytic n=1 Tax=Tanacetum cinerariifolium TaxID=118510 RepID=A0A6L2K5A2_TANCI|nr:integrase, catalytic region, zinc finger, CCHC-type, peptidase aspartic, catalytic [Tanacetum cinerariifolium]